MQIWNDLLGCVTACNRTMTALDGPSAAGYTTGVINIHRMAFPIQPVHRNSIVYVEIRTYLLMTSRAGQWHIGRSAENCRNESLFPTVHSPFRNFHSCMHKKDHGTYRSVSYPVIVSTRDGFLRIAYNKLLLISLRHSQTMLLQRLTCANEKNTFKTTVFLRIKRSEHSDSEL